MTPNVIFFVAENKHFVQIGVRIKFLQKGLVVVVYNGKIEFVTKVLAHHNCYGLFLAFLKKAAFFGLMQRPLFQNWN